MQDLRPRAWLTATIVCLVGCGEAARQGTSANLPDAAVSGSMSLDAAGESRDAATAGVAGLASKPTPAGAGWSSGSGAAAGVGGATPSVSPAAVSGGSAAGSASAGAAGHPDAGASAGHAGASGHAGSAGSSAGSGGQPVAGHAGQATSYRPCPTDGSACRIMPFGDSITDGYNGDTPGGYRVELFRLAHSAGKNIGFVGSASNGPSMVDGVMFPSHHEGHSGWTIAPAGGRSGISTLVDTVMPQYAPNIVLLMIGTNDAIDNYDMVNAPKRLGQLIDAIYAQLPDVLIVVAQLVPSRGDTSQGDDAELTARIETFNASIPALVKAHADAGKHILSVDMFTPFAPNKRTLLEDQWHPNAAGYALLAQQWFASLEPLL